MSEPYTPAATRAPDLTTLSSDDRRLQLRRMLARKYSGVRAVPMSFAQERLWFLDQLVPANPFYNVDAAVRLRGSLLFDALSRALLEICERHETLRTTFGSIEGRPTQFAHRRPNLQLARLALEDDTASAATTRALDIIRQEARRPFDLTRGPVLRASLLQVAPDDHVLMLTMHHIVSDGWSMGVLMYELATLYNAFRVEQPSPLPALPIQYADYALWQRKRLTGERLRDEIDYWKRQLTSVPHLELPTDRQRPAVPTFDGRRVYFDIPTDTGRRVRALGRKHSATLFMTLLAAFQVLLHRDSGQDDVVIGTPIAGRNRAELEPLIGFFVNMLVLRTRVRGEESFRSLLDHVRDVALDAFAHHELPFERLVEELQPNRDLSRNPLCQVVFSLQNTPTSKLALDGLQVSFPSVANETTRFDLVLDVWETPGDEQLHARFEYSRDLFDEATVVAMGQRFVTLLDSITADPDRPIQRLTVLTSSERDRIVFGWNDTAAALPECAGVHWLVARHAAASPESLAVTDDTRRITYGVLDRESNHLANYLVDLGAGPGRRVAVCLEPSVDWAVAIFAVLKCGSAYVALDPASPRERLHRMINDAAPVAVVTCENARARLGGAPCHVIDLDKDREEICRRSDRPLCVSVARCDPAYVIFTSGSTGEPNGVCLEHRGLLNLVAWHQRFYGVTHDDRASQIAGPGFDASVWEIWPYLASGASVHIAKRDLRLDPGRLMEWLAEERITLAFLPTPLAEAALAQPLPDRLSLRALLTGGDRLRRAPAGPLPFTLVNHYGPTEYSVVATAAVIAPRSAEGLEADVAPPIGRPISNTRVYVLDASGELVAAGVPGELAIAGTGLASGYLGRESLTSARFVTNPLALESRAGSERSDNAAPPRMYLTGDRVRWRHDGQLEFLGRRDTQVSVRGFRVELAEIERALARHPAVQQVVVSGRADQHGDARLTAYVVRSDEDSRRDDRARHDRVGHWESLYDATYAASTAADPSFDITGWHSSYTGLAIPAHEMREWVQATVERLRQRQPNRVLEIGVGTGLLLQRLAPHCDDYVGVDFSEVALRTLEARVRSAGLSNVRLQRSTADQVDGFEPHSFDAVILNSVAQYFPGAEYLARVIDRALALVRAGGFVFIGDVRSLPLQATFSLSVELQRAPASMPVAQLLNRIRTRALREEELLIAPGFFAARLLDPRVRDVSVLMKRGNYRNELSRFRYDVFLDTSERDRDDASAAPQWLDWEDDRISLCDVWRLLAQGTVDVLVIRNIPNERLRRETHAAALIAEPSTAMTVGDVRAALLSLARSGDGEWENDLESICARASELGYDADPLWLHHGADGRFDLELRRVAPVPRNSEIAAGELRLRSGPPRPASDPSELMRVVASQTNDPLQFSVGRELIPELRRWVRDRLPDHMVPGSYVFLDRLPLTSNGKVDRQRLPEPIVGRDGLDDEYIASRTPVEEVIAGIWAELLGAERVGVRDDFFERGGHSLLGMQVISRLRDAFRIDLPVSSLFEAPTVEGLAALLIEASPSPESIRQLAQMTLTVSRMSDDEVEAHLKDSGRA